jgi:NAD(P)H-hydrate epimerase
VDGTTGQVLVEALGPNETGEGAVRATVTLTFGLPKVGLFLYPGAEYAGEVIVAALGLPASFVDDPALNMSLVTADEVKRALPERRADTHKGDYGHALMLGGSPGLTGAIAMASEAALRAGAGLVTAAVPQGVQQILALKLTEVMTLALPEHEGLVAREAYEVLVRRAQRATALAIGPGLGTGGEVAECLKMLLGHVTCPLLVDADGLRVLAAHADVFRAIFQTGSVPPVLTPHPGEMAGLTGLSVDAVQKYRLDTAREVAQQWNCVVVLKGAHTIVAAPEGTLAINLTGNAGMSTAGTGDVLAGLIAGFLAQGVDPFPAAIAGVYLHGLAGDLGAAEVGMDSLTAGDLLRHIPAAITRIRRGDLAQSGALVRPR